jgi:UPF0755 protein
MDRDIQSLHPTARWVGAIASMLLFTILVFYTIILSWRITCNNNDEIVIIPKGASVSYTVNIIQKAGCMTSRDAHIFKLAMSATFRNGKLIPGRYTFKGISSIGEMVNLVTTSSKERIKVTLLEGWTIEEIADELNRKLKIDTFKFISLCKDFNFVHSLNIDAPSIEGFLFPDTYLFLSSYTEEQIIKVMVNQFFYQYENRIKPIKGHTSMSMREIITMASIIQGEAMYNDEMPIISSVYHNRIKRKMLLQADPTIQYIIPGKNRRLYNKDLRVDSPYNTYKYKGLPPGPINNPGLDAMIAAVSPNKTSYLYFVADGEGRHIFTRNNVEHNEAKKVLRRKRKEMKRKSK